MKKILLLACAMIHIFAAQAQDLTSLMHQECAVIGKIKEQSHPIVYNMVQETAKALNMKMPEIIYIYNQNEQFNNNAFVYMNLNKVFIGKTLAQTLSYDELKAIISHELSHLKNKHFIKRLAISASALAAAIYGTYLIHEHTDKIAKIIYAWLQSKNNVNDLDFLPTEAEIKNLFRKGSMALMYLPMALGVFKYIRYTEKDADLTALKATKPSYLASALLKLKENTRGMNLAKYLSTYKAPKFIKNLFSTHPSIKERVAYLQEAELKLIQNS